jgi:alkylhydroperoxidase family enzyme
MDSRLPLLNRNDIDDADLQQILSNAERLSTPKPAWYLTLGHNPDMAKAYAVYWDVTHRGGQVEHSIKELMRIAIAQLLGCDFCANQRSVMAIEQGLQESDTQLCAIPDFNNPEPRTRAALHFAHVLVNDTSSDAEYDTAYTELRAVFSDAEIVELGCFAAIAIGGVKFARSLRIDV